MYKLQYYTMMYRQSYEFYDSGGPSRSRVVVNSLVNHHNNSYPGMVYDHDDWQNRLVFCDFFMRW